MVKERNIQGLEQHLLTEKIYRLDYLIFPHHHQYLVDEEANPLLQVACKVINYF